MVSSGKAVTRFEALTEAFQEIRTAFRDEFDIAVGKIADKAGYAESCRFTGCPGAESHALDPAGNKDMKCRNLV